MAESRSEDATSKLVQEIAQKGEEVPESYMIKNDVISPAIDASSNLWEETLLIDFSQLSPVSSSTQNELAKLHSALKNWGCFQVINHGMTSLFLDELLDVSRQFFALPLEEKLKCSITEDFFNGYGNASVISGDQTLNWNDRLFLTVYPEEKRRLQVWPQKPRKFREVLHEFSLSLRKMLEVFLKAMARSLGLKEDIFLKEHGEQGSIDTRFGIYPRCSRPDKVYGVHPHSDRSSITVLLPDKDVPEGLHIQKDDQWFKVPVIPGALFVNLGDYAEVMSNGIFKSVVHRVVTNSERERFSVAAFCTPEPENEVGPITELISSNQPQMYKKVNMKTYKQLFFETYPQGKRVLDALKI
ncbi:protein SRG1-like [Chenopodium quinoa]|uniref:Fe2OG dioxygenase domain-containing protein n=1 Tax=Chenopodium quinoa TaxID=63459 RepID=A0A803LTX7_CHEQI|nr:protein SRG1-like [Chenopodium quinoa]